MGPRSKFLRLLFCCTGLITPQVYAWGPDGHHAVGAIADQLIINTHAGSEVKSLLGELSLRDAAVWADCAKAIDPAKNYTYQSAGTFPECKIFESSVNETQLSDFVRRNDINCDRKPTEESCHKQYHYADIAIQHDHYDRSFHGARNDDIVAAVTSAIQVLRGESALVPFSFKDKREALLVLVHYVGDLHQPLHVGAVYLDATGKRVNPDSGNFDAATVTRGGNEITLSRTSSVSSKNLHAAWDAYPASLTVNPVDVTLLERAKIVPVTSGDVQNWPVEWANETVVAAQNAFKGLKFSKKQRAHWNVTLSKRYVSGMATLKKQQLAKGGKHLADILLTIWP